MGLAWEEVGDGVLMCIELSYMPGTKYGLSAHHLILSQENPARYI